MAVRKLRQDMRGPIICLCGPPGVGKTSVGQSVARAMNRRFHRISLGGMRDVAEIKGHRRTYVGAMPGLIVQALKAVGVVNPVVLLDEIDKVSAWGGRGSGDPSSALLEVLDPEQNSAFVDHYLEVPVDLSKVLFMCTANSLDSIPVALRDRMEIIHLTGYTFQEKLEISKRYLLPKQIELHGLLSNMTGVNISDSTLMTVVQQYTREPGVRELERQLAALLRSLAVKVVTFGANIDYTLTVRDLEEILGVSDCSKLVLIHYNMYSPQSTRQRVYWKCQISQG